MVADEVVEVLARVLGGDAVLPYDFLALLVTRRSLGPRHVADVEHDVPVEGRAALVAAVLRLEDRLGQAAAAVFQVGADVGVAGRPEDEAATWHTSPRGGMPDEA